MEKIFLLQNALTMIEKSISDRINIEQIAAKCFISTRQLYRDFYSLTGHTVNEYIRKRRLSRALNLLRYSEMSFAEIAYSCGYSSQSAMSKAIKYYFDMTATEYRNSTSEYFFPIFNQKAYRQIEVATQKIPDTISVYYYHNKLTGIENQAVDYIRSLIPEYKGRIFGRNEKQSGKQFCYELMLEYSESLLGHLQKTKLMISSLRPSWSCTCASTIVRNDETQIKLAWDHLYTLWRKNSMFDLDDTRYFEEYLFENNKISKLLLYLPVKPRINYYKISISSYTDRMFLTSSGSGQQSEKKASEKLLDFVSKQYPHLLETQTKYYVVKRDQNCTCGININEKRYIPDDGSISMITIPEGLYAVLQATSFGVSCEDDQILMQWIMENGYEAEGEPFTIYDISEGLKEKDVLVNTYVKIKWQKNIRQTK